MEFTHKKLAVTCNLGELEINMLNEISQTLKDESLGL